MKVKKLFLIKLVLLTSLIMVNCTEIEPLENEEVLNAEKTEIQGIKDGEIQDDHI